MVRPRRQSPPVEIEGRGAKRIGSRKLELCKTKPRRSRDCSSAAAFVPAAFGKVRFEADERGGEALVIEVAVLPLRPQVPELCARPARTREPVVGRARRLDTVRSMKSCRRSTALWRFLRAT